MRSIVSVGGGGGHATTLKALKQLTDIVITGITGNTDTGGFTGQLREDYGYLGHIGDLTKCVAALCPDEFFAKALLHRFGPGCMHGHSMKNVLLVALERVAKELNEDPDKALEVLYRICGIAPHRVIPVSRHFTNVGTINMREIRTRKPSVVLGEANIDRRADHPDYHSYLDEIQHTFLDPQVPASEAALNAIRKGDIIVIACGDLHSSILPPLLTGGVGKAIRDSGAFIIFVMNIMTKEGETQGYTALDFKNRVERAIGKPVDRIVFDNSKNMPKALLDYLREHRRMEKVTLGELREYVGSPRFQSSLLVKAPLAMVTPEGNIHHDPNALAKVFRTILDQVRTKAEAAAS